MSTPNPLVSRYLARVAYVTKADAAMRHKLAALEDTATVDDLPGWVPRAPDDVMDQFREPEE